MAAGSKWLIFLVGGSASHSLSCPLLGGSSCPFMIDPYGP